MCMSAPPTLRVPQPHRHSLPRLRGWGGLPWDHAEAPVPGGIAQGMDQGEQPTHSLGPCLLHFRPRPNNHPHCHPGIPKAIGC